MRFCHGRDGDGVGGGAVFQPKTGSILQTSCSVTYAVSALRAVVGSPLFNTFGIGIFSGNSLAGTAPPGHAENRAPGCSAVVSRAAF